MNAASDDREDGTGNPGSPKQIAWVEIANQVRLKLEQRLVGFPELTCDECLSLTKAFREALFFEQAAMAFDVSADKQNEQWS